MASNSMLAAAPQKVAAVCYRHSGSSIEFLLVRTSSGRWTFPKGNIELHLSLPESAQLEAFEEAGAMGRIERRPFSSYLHAKRGCRNAPTRSGSLVATFLLEVEQTVPPPETHRQPTWFGPHETKLKLARGRGRKQQNEFSRVVDAARHIIRAASK